MGQAVQVADFSVFLKWVSVECPYRAFPNSRICQELWLSCFGIFCMVAVISRFRNPLFVRSKGGKDLFKKFSQSSGFAKDSLYIGRLPDFLHFSFWQEEYLHTNMEIPSLKRQKKIFQQFYLRNFTPIHSWKRFSANREYWDVFISRTAKGRRNFFRKGSCYSKYRRQLF